MIRLRAALVERFNNYKAFSAVDYLHQKMPGGCYADEALTDTQREAGDYLVIRVGEGLVKSRDKGGGLVKAYMVTFEAETTNVQRAEGLVDMVAKVYATCHRRRRQRLSVPGCSLVLVEYLGDHVRYDKAFPGKATGVLQLSFWLYESGIALVAASSSFSSGDE